MIFSEKTYSNKSKLVDFSSEWCLPCMNNTEYFYEVSLNWQSDRKGIIESPALNKTIDIGSSQEFPNGKKGQRSLEHLFVAAVNSCLMTTFLSVAENSELEFLSFDSTAIGKIDIVDGKYLISEITLKPIVIISNQQNKERTERLLQKSEYNCLIANSTKSKILFNPEVKIK